MYKTLELNMRPSDLVEIEDSYTAYCFDEAVAYILRRLMNGDTILENSGSSEEMKKVYSKPSDFYSKFDT